jgi:hypothetical protein
LLESLTSIHRAGASIVLSFDLHAKEAAMLFSRFSHPNTDKKRFNNS